MNKLYVNEKYGLYTEISLTSDGTVTKVPEGWETFSGTWEDAQEEGFVFMGWPQAGFLVEGETPQRQEPDPWSSQAFG